MDAARGLVPPMASVESEREGHSLARQHRWGLLGYSHVFSAPAEPASLNALKPVSDLLGWSTIGADLAIGATLNVSHTSIPDVEGTIAGDALRELFGGTPAYVRSE